MVQAVTDTEFLKRTSCATQMLLVMASVRTKLVTCLHSVADARELIRFPRLRHVIGYIHEVLVREARTTPASIRLGFLHETSP